MFIIDYLIRAYHHNFQNLILKNPGQSKPQHASEKWNFGRQGYTYLISIKRKFTSCSELFTPYNPTLEIFEIRNFSFSPCKCDVTKKVGSQRGSYRCKQWMIADPAIHAVFKSQFAFGSLIQLSIRKKFTSSS